MSLSRCALNIMISDSSFPSVVGCKIREGFILKELHMKGESSHGIKTADY